MKPCNFLSPAFPDRSVNNFYKHHRIVDPLKFKGPYDPKPDDAEIDQKVEEELEEEFGDVAVAGAFSTKTQTVGFLKATDPFAKNKMDKFSLTPGAAGSGHTALRANHQINGDVIIEDMLCSYIKSYINEISVKQIISKTIGNPYKGAKGAVVGSGMSSSGHPGGRVDKLGGTTASGLKAMNKLNNDTFNIEEEELSLDAREKLMRASLRDYIDFYNVLKHSK